MKYQGLQTTTLGLKYIGIKKSEFVANTSKPAKNLILDIQPQEGLQVLLNVISRIQIQISQRN